MQGRLDDTINGYFDAVTKFPETMRGVGATMEGIETNPILYDALFEVPWLEDAERQGWLASWQIARYGVENEPMVKAWKLLSSSVYAGPPFQQSDVEAVICARPELEVKKVSGWGTSKLFYDINVVREAAGLMLQEKDKLASHPNYRYDLADVVRQTLTDSTYYLLQDIAASYQKGDKKAFRRGYQNYLGMISDIDRLLSQSEMFTLDRWVESARNLCDEVPGLSDADRNWDQPGKFDAYVVLGNQFKFGDATIQLDLMNRGTSARELLFDNFSIMGEIDYLIAQRVNIFAKVTYDKVGNNYSSIPAIVGADGNELYPARGLFLFPGTEMTRFGGGVEYYPLGAKGNRDLRLHAAYVYNMGNNTNPGGTAVDKGSFLTVGLTWKIDVIEGITSLIDKRQAKRASMM